MNKTRKPGLIAAIGMAAGLLMAGCTASPPAASSAATDSGTAPVHVTGSVTYRERFALAPDAQVIVRVQDVSRMDAPATVLAEQRIIAAGRQVPIAFDLPVDPERIDPRMHYSVSARIERGGQLMYISDTAYMVLTQNAGDTAQVIVKRVGPQ